MKTNGMEINVQVSRLADARSELVLAKAAEKEIKEEFKDIFDRAKAARVAVKEVDEWLRELALAMFEEFGDGDPHESVKIVKTVTVEINDEEAVKVWAVINRRFELVNLNTQAIQAITLTSGMPSGLINEGHITINKDDHAVRIGSDLTKFETPPPNSSPVSFTDEPRGGDANDNDPISYFLTDPDRIPDDESELDDIPF